MRPPLALRTGRRFRTDPLEALRERAGSNGAAPAAARPGLIRFRAGATSFAVVTDPEEIRRVLVTDAADYGEGKWTLRGRRVMGDCLITREGEPHRERRALVQPHFERARVTRHAESIVRRCERLAERWPDGAVTELRSQMGEMALAAAAEAMLDVELEERAAELLPALWTMLAEIPRPWMPAPRTLRLRRARARVDREVAELIAARREELARAGGRAIRAAGGDGDEADLLTTLIADRGPGGRPLSDREIADEVVSLLIASIDTTPGTLAWCCLELARRPALEQGILDQIAEELGGEAAGPDVLSRLPLLAEAVDETLRLHPPVHFIDRRPHRDVTIAGQPVAKGTYLLISPLLTQRDPRYWDAPDEFRPERWRGLDRRSRPGYSFFPFGGGPHTCIGMALARLELGLALATILPRASLRPSGDLAGETGTQTTRFPMAVQRRAPQAADPGKPNPDDPLALIDGLVYADLFDCAVTLDEAWLYAGRRAEREEVDRALCSEEGVGALVARRNGLYCLRGREDLLARRGPRLRRAAGLARRGRRVARLLRHVPFVRGVYVTGSAAAGDAGPRDDLDLLVVCASGRIATVFLILGSFSRLTHRRLFCPNHYISEDALASRRHDPYVAHELARTLPLVAGADLRAANGWIAAYVPNAARAPRRTVHAGAPAPYPPGGRLQRALEAALGGRLGDALEARAAPIAEARLRAHHEARGSEPPAAVVGALAEGGELRFHGAPFAASVPARLEARRAEVREWLRAGPAPVGPAPGRGARRSR